MQKKSSLSPVLLAQHRQQMWPKSCFVHAIGQTIVSIDSCAQAIAAVRPARFRRRCDGSHFAE